MHCARLGYGRGALRGAAVSRAYHPLEDYFHEEIVCNRHWRIHGYDLEGCWHQRRCALWLEGSLYGFS